MLKAGDGTGVRAQSAFTLSVLGVPDAEGAVRRRRHKALVTEIQKADKRSVTLKGEDALTGFKRPNLDQIVHGATNATIASMIKDNTVNLLGMALQTLYSLASGYSPHTNCAIVAPTDKGIAVSCYCTNGVVMASQRTNEVGVVEIIGGRSSGLHNAPIAWLWQLPHA